VTSATTPPILTPLTPAAVFLVLTINDGGEATVHEALTDFGHPVAALSFRVPQANLSLVAGIGSRAWDRLFSGPKPANAHIAVNVIKDEDGNELKIVRANMPFGTLADGDSGTYYIAYSGNPDITERMLRRMFIGEPEGNTDRVLDFSTAHTGGMFFVPTVDFLASPPPLPGAATGDSLAIGSLKGQPQ